MSEPLTQLFIEKIDPTWIPYLRELHWSGQLMSYVGKGYATFQLTEQEKSKWKLSNQDISRIKEILQTSIDSANAKEKTSEFLQYLSSYSYIYVPNQLENTTIVDEVRKETPENIERLKGKMLIFIEPIINEDFVKLKEYFVSWEGRNVRTTLHKAASILAEELSNRKITLKFEDMESITSVPLELQPFWIILTYFFNRKPETTWFTLFKDLLLLENEEWLYKTGCRYYRNRN